ncbi:MAG: bifunctional 5,10-methylenetetrahydrofolate dehydrogenase/5,10-methenyltetrahydrofolate cyclohydrolase [bacterium]|nr:bifunctional 5,10-methylenetetrahydrofolate dehydrogenase/5,10-methenyltetrahydrofolate cyclohydrolase [bacterium]
MDQKIIDGRKWAKIHEENLRREIEKLNMTPQAVNILVGDEPSSVLYTRIKENKAQSLGLDFKTLRFSKGTSFSEVLKTINRLNTEVDGLMIQLPLPQEFLGEHQSEELTGIIDPKKDIDGLTGKGSFPPAAVGAILSLLRDEGIEVAGKKAVVVGASDLVGKPAAFELEKLGAMVEICDSKTENLKDVTLSADILVSATGVPGLITGQMVKDEVVVIDIGAEKVDGKIVGDVEFQSVYPKASKITPVPGGVGPMTVVTLMENMIKLAKEKE